MSIPISLLDLAHVVEGSDPAESFARCVEAAQKAEALGYHRVWYAEHHNIISVASSATSVLIAHIANHTQTIRVGAGGIMLPNHSPLTIAEQFGTLATLHPGRIDLGLGRAPGGDRGVIRALRKDYQKAGNRFADDVEELIAYLAPPSASSPEVQAVPGQGTEVPVYILGSSLFGAQLAARLGLPYAFASHFAPQYLMQAADTYRREFKPSKHLDEPYFIMACNIIAAETEDEARFHFSTLIQAFIGIITGRRGLTPRPVHNIQIPPEIRPSLEAMLQCSAIGTEAQIAESLSLFRERLAPDEFIVSMPFHDHAARLKSLEIAMAAAG